MFRCKEPAIRYLLSLLLLLSAPAFAQEGEGTSKTKTRAPRKAQTQLQMGVALWQESMTLRAGAPESKMVSQSMGLLASLGRSNPIGRSKWNYTYGATLGVGTIKGKGNNDNVPDELKNQLWYLLGGSAGVMFRTSPVSELGLSVPIYYRYINWQLEAGSPLEIEDEPLSVGIAGEFVTHLSRYSALHLTLTQQYQWNGTMWGAFYQRSFR